MGDFNYQEFAQALATAMAGHRPPKQERIAENALKGMSSQPHYKTGSNFRNFEVQYRVWRGNVGLDTTDAAGIGIVPADVQAQFLVSAFKEEPALRIATISKNTVAWNQSINDANLNDPNARFEAFFGVVRRLFLPEGETRMAKLEFMKYVQKPDQNMSAYVTNKIALWEDAYTNARQHHFQILLDETIKGTGNTVIKRELRRSQITTPEQLRDRAINLVATERQCMDDGSAESTSYDYLTQVSLNNTHNDVMMDEGMSKFGEPDACHRCGKRNHRAADCKTPWNEIKGKPPKQKSGGIPQNKGGNNKGAANNSGKKPKYPPNNPNHKNLTCTWCRIRGHIEPDCRGKMAGKPKKLATNPGNRGRGGVKTIDGENEVDDNTEATEPFLVETGESQ